MSVCVAGDKIVSGSNDYTIKLWGLDTVKCLKTLSGHGNIVMSVIMARDKIVSGSK